MCLLGANRRAHFIFVAHRGPRLPSVRPYTETAAMTIHTYAEPDPAPVNEPAGDPEYDQILIEIATALTIALGDGDDDD